MGRMGQFKKKTKKTKQSSVRAVGDGNIYMFNDVSLIF